jgi:mannose-6-phosphate isomerase-like protein (cupin superfamily)
MGKLMVKKFSAADERRSFESHGFVETIRIGEGTVGRAVFEPGWKWSVDVKPLANTDTCEVHHSAYVLSGRMHIVMDDGEEADVEAGDLIELPPGHDGWTLGSEACVVLDFAGMQDYAHAAAESGTGAREEIRAAHFHEGA